MLSASVITAQANLGDSAQMSKKRYGSSTGPTMWLNLERWIYRAAGYDIYVQYDDTGKTKAVKYIKTPLNGVEGEPVFGPITSNEISRLMQVNAPSLIFREVPVVDPSTGSRTWLTTAANGSPIMATLDYSPLGKNRNRIQTLTIWTKKAWDRMMAATGANPNQSQPATEPVPNNRIDLKPI